MKNEGALRMRFFRYAKSIGPMCHYFLLTLGVSRFPVGPMPRYRTSRKEHALSIVRDEFRPAIPRWVARQQCPSPLHRHHQLKTIAASNGIIYHRTVPSLLTVCLSLGDNPTSSRPFVAMSTSSTTGTTRKTKRELSGVWNSRASSLRISWMAQVTYIFNVT